MINKIDLINAFRPSLAKHILTCYKAFEYEYTEEDTPLNEYAEKGIKLHKISEDLYNNPKLKIDNTFTKDDINLVKGYVYYIKSIAKNADIAEVEKKVYLEKLSENGVKIENFEVSKNLTRGQMAELIYGLKIFYVIVV